MKTNPNHRWMVFSTATREVWLMLYCTKTGRTASVRDPSEREWSKAWSAPSKPYEWKDHSRVVIDEPDPKRSAAAVHFMTNHWQRK